MPENIYRRTPQNTWKCKLMYMLGGCTCFFVLLHILRDASPVTFKEPSPTDLQAPAGIDATQEQLDDVYWRVSVGHTNTLLESRCQTTNYTVFTHKNVLFDGQPMPTSYIYRCKTRGVLNARAVFSGSSKQTVKCRETHAGTTKIIHRNYPFSLKFISADTFEKKTKIIRESSEACVWLHAIAIVNSLWD